MARFPIFQDIKNTLLHWQKALDGLSFGNMNGTVQLTDTAEGDLLCYDADDGLWKNEPKEFIATIWAEESGGLSTTVNGGLQFSFGNGNTAAHGPVMAYAGTIIAMSLQAEVSSATTGVVDVAVNGTAQGGEYQLNSPGVANGGSYKVFETPVSFAAGDKLTFRTTTSHGSTTGVTMTMWVKFSI